MKGNIGQLMKQAQAMQENMQKMQDQLATLEVEGQSGAGLVKVQMTCKYDVKRVSIDPRTPDGGAQGASRRGPEIGTAHGLPVAAARQGGRGPVGYIVEARP